MDAANKAETLRQRAQQAFADRHTDDGAAHSTADSTRLLHELQVHQIELQMQNEELRQAQEALEVSQARYFDLFDLAPVGYVTLDEKGLIREANLAAATLLGTTRQAAVKQRLSQFVLAEDEDIYYLHHRRLLQTGEAQWCEVRTVQTGGNDRWVRLEMMLAPSEEDQSPERRVVLTDITERKQAIEALRASESRFRKQFESMPIPTFIWKVDDQRFTLLDVNAATEQLTQGKAREFLGITADQLYADRPDLLEHFQSCLEQRTVIIYETDYHARGTGLDRIIIFTFAYVSPELILLHAEDVTERRRTEAELQSEEANLLALVENTDGSIWSVDSEYRLITGNSVFHSNVRSASGSEFADGDNVLSRDSFGETNDVWRSYYDRGLRGEQFHEEISARFGTSSIWMECRFSPIYDGEKCITGVTVFGRDITEQKRTVEILRESEERFRLAFENANDGVCLVDLEGRLLQVNARMCEMFGYSRQELEGMSIQDFTHPDSLNISLQYIRRAVQEHRDHDGFEKRYLHRNGHVIWGQVSSSLVRDERGEPLHFISHIQDITERKKAEDALKSSQQNLERAQQLGHLGSWEWDVLNETLFWSDELYHIMGVDQDFAMTYAGIEALIHPDDRVKNNAMTQKALTTADAVDFEFRIVRPDGKVRSIQQNIVVERDEGGAATTLIGTMQDITERKLAEAAEEHLHAQLAQAQKMETVGRLAGGVAHDFNNMLAVILLRTELALQLVDASTPLHRNLTTIHTTAQRSAELVRQLLGFARKQTIAPRVQDLNAAIKNTLPMLRNLIGMEIEVMWQPGAALWPIKMDTSQIDQIMANLFVNARDAIDGVGAIKIETKNVTLGPARSATGLDIAPGDYVMLSVSNDGCGINRENLGHIFEPFFTRKEVGKGTGLGLATVDGIVQQNHGHIQVYSEPGIGTSFKIYLPRFAEKIVAPSDNRPAPLRQGQGEAVLLVEDEVEVLQITADTLQSLGYNVMMATRPAEAIRMATMHTGTIQLLVTDIIMPEMNGRTLAEEIMVIQPGIKCLYISGYPADFIARRGILEDGVHLLQKPFSLETLASRVSELLTA